MHTAYHIDLTWVVSNTPQLRVLCILPHSSNHSPFADLLCNNNVRDECAHNGQKANIPFVDDQE